MRSQATFLNRYLGAHLGFPLRGSCPEGTDEVESCMIGLMCYTASAGRTQHLPGEHSSPLRARKCCVREMGQGREAHSLPYKGVLQNHPEFICTKKQHSRVASRPPRGVTPAKENPTFNTESGILKGRRPLSGLSGQRPDQESPERAEPSLALRKEISCGKASGRCCSADKSSGEGSRWRRW